jgi:hypothetical protein
MNLRDALRPKQPRNLAATAGVCAALLLVAAGASFVGWPWSPKRGTGLAFGILAALLFVFEMAYPSRRPRARPLGTAKNWLQAHVYLGVIALLSVFIHTGFSWPHGWFGWALLVLSGWTTASGLIGVLLQKWIPLSIAGGLRVTALYERIPELIGELRKEADLLMDGTSDVLENFYRTQVAQPLSRLQPSWSYVVDVRGGRDRALEPFQRLSQFVGEDEKDRVADLMNIYIEKLELDAQYSVQRALRAWPMLTLHVPAAGLLIGLLVVHVVTWIVY